jgi:hypothetical protein
MAEGRELTKGGGGGSGHCQTRRPPTGGGGRRVRPGEKDTESSWSAPVG